MAKLNEESGRFSGLVGPVIMGSWRGIPVLRHKGIKSKKPRSQEQLEQQAKMGLMSKFIYSMRALLNNTFSNYAIQKTGANAAFRCNFKNGITGTYPELAINYPLIFVSRGDLPGIVNLTMNMGERDVTLHWDNNAGYGSAKDTDECMAVFHMHHNGIRHTCYSERVSRKSETVTFTLPPDIRGTIHMWMVCQSSDGKETADSVYVGEVDGGK